MTGWSKLFLAALGCLACAAAAAADETVTVKLKASASAADQRVCVDDVATLEGGTLGLRHRIGRLDLGELNAQGGTLQVTRNEVVFRIQLAGMEKDRFRVTGAERVHVTLARTEIPEEEILAAAEQHVRQRLPGNAAEATIRVTRSTGPVVVDANWEEIRLEAEMRSTGLPLGRVQVEVGVYVNGAKRRSIPVQLEVKVQQTVAVAGRRIERGEVLSAANLRYEQRTVDGLHQFAASGEGLVGKKAKQLLLPGQVVSLRDVEAEAPPQSTVLIKQRDRVFLQAKLGNNVVTAVGEAMQDGREGQLIQVRNTESKKTVVGRVVGRGTVEVDY